MLHYIWKFSLVLLAVVVGAAWATTSRTAWHWATAAQICGASGLVVAVLVGRVQLRTRLDLDGVRLWYSPWQSSWQFIPWSQIRRGYVRRYSPVGEYGGWGGIRNFSSENVAYNVWGRQGLQLVLTNGDSLLIGTQRPHEIERVLRQLRITGRREDTPSNARVDEAD